MLIQICRDVARSVRLLPQEAEAEKTEMRQERARRKHQEKNWIKLHEIQQQQKEWELRKKGQNTLKPIGKTQFWFTLKRAVSRNWKGKRLSPLRKYSSNKSWQRSLVSLLCKIFLCPSMVCSSCLLHCLYLSVLSLSSFSSFLFLLFLLFLLLALSPYSGFTWSSSSSSYHLSLCFLHVNHG